MGVLNSKRHRSGKLEGLGDAAMSIGWYDVAISQYSDALFLNPVAPQGLFIKRSKAYMAKGLWPDTLSDANKVCWIRMNRVRRVVFDSTLLTRLYVGDRAGSIVAPGLRAEVHGASWRGRLW